MSERAEALVKEAHKLSPAERVELVNGILASLDEPDGEIDRLWAAEAEERVAAYRRGEIKAVEFNEVLAKYQPS